MRLDRIGYKRTAVMKQLIDEAINTVKETQRPFCKRGQKQNKKEEE